VVLMVVVHRFVLPRLGMKVRMLPYVHPAAMILHYAMLVIIIIMAAA